MSHINTQQKKLDNIGLLERPFYSYNDKYVHTPFYIEHYHSSTPIFRGFRSRRRLSVSRVSQPTSTGPRRSFSLARSRRNLRYSISCNITVGTPLTFWTFTFNEEYKNIGASESASRLFFSRFMYTFKRKYFPDLKYCAIAELQKKNNRNVWHFHVLFLNLPFFPHDLISKHWRAGFVFVTKRRTEIKDIHHLISYMSKYLTKDTDVSKGKRLFWTSRNLTKPVTSYFSPLVDISDYILYSSTSIQYKDKTTYRIQIYNTKKYVHIFNSTSSPPTYRTKIMARQRDETD